MSNLQDYGQIRSYDGDADEGVDHEIRSVTSEPTIRESYQQQHALSPRNYSQFL